jgi:hypothetical protein
MIWTFRALQPHFLTCQVDRKMNVCIISSGHHRIWHAFVGLIRFLDPLDTASHFYRDQYIVPNQATTL